MEFLLFVLLVVYLFLFISMFISMFISLMPFEFQILDRHSALKFIFLSATVSHPGPEVAKRLGWGFGVGVQSFAFSKQNTVCVYPKVKLLCHLSTHGFLKSATLMRFLANLRRAAKVYWEDNGFCGSTLSCTTHIQWLSYRLTDADVMVATHFFVTLS